MKSNSRDRIETKQSCGDVATDLCERSPVLVRQDVDLVQSSFFIVAQDRSCLTAANRLDRDRGFSRRSVFLTLSEFVAERASVFELVLADAQIESVRTSAHRNWRLP